MEKTNGQQPEQYATFTDLLDSWLDLAGDEPLDTAVATAILVHLSDRELKLPAWIASVPPADQPAALRQAISDASGTVHAEHVIDDDRLVPVREVGVGSLVVREYRDLMWWDDIAIPWTDLASPRANLRFLGYGPVHELANEDPTETGVGLILYALEEDVPPRAEGSPPFLAEVRVGTRSYLAACPRWTDALALLSVVAPAVSASITARLDSDQQVEELAAAVK